MEGEFEYTLDDAIEHIGFGRFQVKLIFIAGLSWMADAMEMMVLSILSPILLCEWNLSRPQEAIITTIVFLGQGCGSPFFGYISDKYGRKKGLYGSVIIVLFFGILSSQAPSYVWILILRFLVGFGIGGVPQAVTIVTEVLPSHTRGRSIVLLAIFWALGSIFAAAIAIGAISALNWRWYLIFITIPMLLFVFTGLWLPESPRFLLTTNQYDKVLILLKRIAKDNNKELLEGTLIRRQTNESRGRIFDLFTKQWRGTIFLLFAIWFTSAFTYYGIVLLTTEIFQTGIDGCHPHHPNATSSLGQCKKLTKKDYINFMLTSIAEFPGVFIAVFLIEWLDRKKTLSTLFGLASVSFLLLAICTGRTWSVIFIFAVRGFVTGSFQAAYVYTPEVLPTNVRAVGLGMCSTFARLGAMATPFVAQVLIHQSFYWVVGVYSTFLIICVIAPLLLQIETKGKSLEDHTEEMEMRERNGYESFT